MGLVLESNPVGVSGSGRLQALMLTLKPDD
jgi:hypothetical protein